MNIVKNEKGYTLIELLLLVFFIVLTALLGSGLLFLAIWSYGQIVG